MFFSKKARKSTQSAGKRTSTHTSRIESLEDRKMMTNTHIVLDFTPDTHRGTFYDTFRYTKDTRNVSPGFLDFNKDGYVSSTDAKIAAGQVAARVKALFANAAYGFNVKVGYGDVMVNNKLGTQWLNWGLQRRNDQVQVMYFGGRNGGHLGVAPKASDGTNVEGYGCTYTQEVAYMLWQRQNAGWSVRSQDFVYSVAAAAAHEIGHMYGLRHARNQYSNDIMNPVQSTRPETSRFISNVRQTDNGTNQSAYNELRRSFYGQSTHYGGYGYGSYLEANQEVEQGHDDDCCKDRGGSVHQSAIPLSPISLDALAAQNVDHLYASNKTDFSKHAVDILMTPEDHSEPALSMTAQTASNAGNPERKGPSDRTAVTKSDLHDTLLSADWQWVEANRASKK